MRLSSLALLACCLAGGARPAAGEDVPEEKKKEEKPKIPRFKCSAWCAFRDLKFAGEEAKPPAGKEEVKKDLESEQTRRTASNWSGFSRAGNWMTLVLEMQNTTEKDQMRGQVEVRLDPSEPDSQTNTQPYITRYIQEFELAPAGPTGPPQRLQMSLLCPNYSAGAVQAVITVNREVYHRTVSLRELYPGRDELVVVLSDQPGAFRFLMEQGKKAGAGFGPEEDPLGTPQGRRWVAVMRPEDLPARWHDLTMANLIIVDGPPREALDDARIDALEAYCQAGGSLLITPSGKDPTRLKPRAGAKRSIADLAGVTVRDLAQLPNLDLADMFSPGPDWSLSILDVTPSAEGLEVFRNRATGFVEKVHRPLGRGHVTFLTFSLSDPNLRDTEVRQEAPLGVLAQGRGCGEVLFASAAALPSPSNLENRGPPSQGLAEFRERMNESLADDTPVETPARGMVVSFLLLYLLAAVPVNYFVFGWFKRREVAWLMVPLHAGVFCVIAYFWGYHGKLGVLTVNEASVVEAGLDQGAASARTFVCLYSPVRKHYQLTFGSRETPCERVQAAPGHLLAARSRRGLEQELAELVLGDDGAGLWVRDLLVQHRATQRLEVVHRLSLNGGFRGHFEYQPQTRAYKLKIQNRTPYTLCNPAVFFLGADGTLQGVSLPDDLPAEMAEPQTLAGKIEQTQDPRQVFFEARKTAFRNARGQGAVRRAQLLGRHVGARVGNYQDSLLVGWLDAGLLPVSLPEGEEQPKLQGFGLLVLPLGERSTVKVETFSRADELPGGDDFQTLPADEQVVFKRPAGGEPSGRILLRLTPTGDPLRSRDPRLRVTLVLHALKREELRGELRVSVLPTRVKGGLEARLLERKMTRGDTASIRPARFDLAAGGSTTVSVEAPLRNAHLGTNQSVILEIQLKGLEYTGLVDAGADFWPLSIREVRVEFR